MSGRFDYVKYDEEAIGTQDKMKQIVTVLEGKILSVGAMTTIENMNNPGIARLVDSKKNAIKSLEECYMWIGKAIRDDQIVRNGSAPLQEERTTS